jgi:hypothetical protein
MGMQMQLGDDYKSSLWSELEDGDIVYIKGTHLDKECFYGPHIVANAEERRLKTQQGVSFLHCPQGLYTKKDKWDLRTNPIDACYHMIDRQDTKLQVGDSVYQMNSYNKGTMIVFNGPFVVTEVDPLIIHRLFETPIRITSEVLCKKQHQGDTPSLTKSFE